MKTIERATHTIDASGRPLGRVATEVAVLLMGKNKPTYLPNVDAGEFVRVINLGSVHFSGKKLEQKEYHWSSGRPGGLKTKKISATFAENPADLFRRAVSRMLPRNTFRITRLKRLTVIV